MSLVPALLQAIVRVDGEALVMHAGDKPYVVAPTEQVDLASRGLTLEAVNGIVSQLLPMELQSALDEFGAVQHELASMAEFPGEHFTVVAARGGNDVWVEIRRRRIPEDDRVPDEFFASSPTQAAAAEAVAQVAMPHAGVQDAVAQMPAPHAAATAAALAHGVPTAAQIVDDNDELPIEILGFDTPAEESRAIRISATSPTASAEQPVELNEDLLLPDVGHLWPGQTAPAARHDAVDEATRAETLVFDG